MPKRISNKAGEVSIWRGLTIDEITVITHLQWVDSGHRYDVFLERDASACDNDPYSVEFVVDGQKRPVLEFFSAPEFRWQSESQYNKFSRTLKEALYHLTYEAVVAMG